MRVTVFGGCYHCGHPEGDSIEAGKWLHITCARCGEEVGHRRNPNYKPMPKRQMADYALIALAIVVAAWALLSR